MKKRCWPWQHEWHRWLSQPVDTVFACRYCERCCQFDLRSAGIWLRNYGSPDFWLKYRMTREKLAKETAEKHAAVMEVLEECSDG